MLFQNVNIERYLLEKKKKIKKFLLSISIKGKKKNDIGEQNWTKIKRCKEKVESKKHRDT